MTDATNETQAAATVAPAAPNSNTIMVEQPFHFKKEKIKDEQGNVIGEGKKLPSAKLHLPVPTTGYLVEVLQGGEATTKERDLLLNAVSAIVYDQAREQINAFREANKDITEVTNSLFNYDKLLWTAIANLPPSQRASSVPGDDDMQAFFESYKEVMPAASGKDAKKIATHIDIFKDGFKRIRAHKPMLEVFKDALAVYVKNAPPEALEDNGTVVEYFDGRLERMLTAEAKVSMDDI